MKKTPESPTTSQNETLQVNVVVIQLKSSESIKYKYEGKTYHFCDTPCEVEFKSHPKKYVQK